MNYLQDHKENKKLMFCIWNRSAEYSDGMPPFCRIVSALSCRYTLAGTFSLVFPLLLLFTFLLFAAVPPCMAGNIDAEKKDHATQVLIINSYHQGFRWTDDIVAAVTATMSAKLNKVEFHIEYMDCKRHRDKHLSEIFFESLFSKYQHMQPDIVITSDDNALDFVKRYHDQLFPRIPVVFCGVNSVKNGLSVNRNYFTGLIETLDMAANIDLIRHLLPQTNEVVIVSDGTPTGIGTRQMAKEVEQDHPDMTFTYLNGEELGTEEMLDRLQQLKMTSAVIAPAWYLDKNGKTFDNKAIYPRIAIASPVPVFSTSSANLGMGIIGGKLNSGSIQGEYAANKALLILSGGLTTKDLQIETTSSNRYMFDDRQLIRFGIVKSRLPAGSIIINRPIPLYERNKTITAIAVTAFLMLLVIIMILLSDIHQRRQMEKILLESEERFRTLHNASFGGIFIHEKGNILDCNQGLSELTGYASEELIGTDGYKLVAPDWLDVVKRNIASGSEHAYEVEGMRKDGSRYPLYINGRNIPYKRRTARIVEFRDITEQKNAEQEKLRLESQLHQSRKMESVGQLAGGVAHDFNNMLSAILGHAELAKMQCSRSDSVLSHLKGIEKAALRSSDLVKQLLAFARQQTIAPKVLDVNYMSGAMLKMLGRIIGEDIELSWMPGLDLWKIKMDPSQVDQLLVNLCVNARDAIRGVGRITIETKNVTFDEAYCGVNLNFLPGDYMMLAVSDDGCGMSKEIIEHIFEPFFTTKDMGEGTGLGLATVYGIVKQNKGFINVYSEPDSGTTFRIYLPRCLENGSTEVAEFIKDVPKGKGEILLLVEDESLILGVAKVMLEELGYEVLIAAKPQEAIDLVKNDTAGIQLLITDVIMPEMNGRQLAKLIRDIRPEVKCLYTSGYTANVIAHHGVLDEDVCFLPKPFSMHDLAVKVRQALEQEILLTGSSLP